MAADYTDVTAIDLPGTTVRGADLYLDGERITDATRIGNSVLVVTEQAPDGHWFPLDGWLRIEVR